MIQFSEKEDVSKARETTKIKYLFFLISSFSIFFSCTSEIRVSVNSLENKSKILHQKDFKNLGLLGGEISDITKLNNYILITRLDFGLEVYDFQSETNFNLISKLKIEGGANGLLISTDQKYAYIATSKKGVFIIDVQNISTPKIISNLSISDSANYLSSFGSKLAFNDGTTNLKIYDTTLPEKPIQVGSINLTNPIKDILFLDTNHIAVIEDTVGIHFYDISDPSNIIPLDSYAQARGLQIELSSSGDELIFIEKDSYIFILDISNLNSVSVISQFETAPDFLTNKKFALTLDKSRAYIINSAILSVDLSDLSSPKPIKQYEVIKAQDLLFFDTDTFIIGQGGLGLSAVNVNDKSFEFLDKLPASQTMYSQALSDDGTILLTGTGINYSSPGDTVIFDISDPSNRVEIGRITTTRPAQFVDISADKTKVYILDGPRFSVYDITIPSTPVLLDVIDDGTYFGPLGVLSGDENFFYCMGQRLRVIDLSDLNNLTYSSSAYTMNAYALDVTSDNNYAFAGAHGGDDIRVFDISNPLSPTFVHSFNLSFSDVDDIKVSQDNESLFVASPFKLEVFNILDPLNPLSLFADNVIFGGLFSKIQLFNNENYIGIQTTDDNLFIYDLKNLSTPEFLTHISDVEIFSIDDNHKTLFTYDSTAGLKTIDISNIGHVSPEASLVSIDNVQVMASFPNSTLGYISDGHNLYYVDFKDFKILNKISLSGVSHIDISDDGSTLYTTIPGFMKIYDISNPVSPSLLSSTTILSTSTSFYKQFEKAIFRYFSSIFFFDITDILNPTPEGSFSSGAMINGYQLIDENNLVISTSTEIKIYDISNPSSSTLIASFTPSESLINFELDKKNNIIYGVGSNNKIIPIDISDFNNISEKQPIRNITAQKLKMIPKSNKLFTLLPDEGLQVIEIKSPTELKLIKSIATSSEITEIHFITGTDLAIAYNINGGIDIIHLGEI